MARPKVLVIEDDFLIAVSVQEMLEALGCEVLGPIGTMAKALDACQSTDADAAILDLVLNQELAYPIADALVARGIPFGFASGFDRIQTNVLWQSRPFLRKPFTEADLRTFLLLILPITCSPEGTEFQIAGGLGRW